MEVFDCRCSIVGGGKSRAVEGSVQIEMVHMMNLIMS